MNRRPSTKGNAEIVDKYIGTGYDVVKYVHDNMTMLNYLTSSIPNALKYLGGHNEPPTVRLDGSPIQDGDFYFDADTYALNYYHLAKGVWFAVDPAAIVASMQRAEAAAKESQTFARVAERSAVTTAGHVAAAADSVASARIYQEDAKVQANLAKGSATASGVSADAAKVSETSAARSAADAIVTLAQAVTQAQNALASANTATTQAQASKVSADNAKVSETASKQSETAAQTSKDAAVASATTATAQANLARMWAVDDPLNSAKYWAEQSHLASTGAVLSGGVFDPAKDVVKEYPNVVGVTIDTVWFISMGDRTVYTFRTGTLAGQITTSGDQLFYDTPNNMWTLIKAGWINPIITVNGKKGPDVTLGATDVGTYDKAVIDKAIADSVAVSSVNNQTGAVVLDHADVGAVSELGGTIRGKVIVAAPAEQLVLRETDTADSDYVFDVNNGNLNIRDNTGLKLTFQKGNETLLNGGLNCSGQVKDTGKRVYGPDNKPTAADVGALSLDGGTLQNTLVVGGGTVATRMTTSGEVAYYQGGHVSDADNQVMALSGYLGRPLTSLALLMKDGVPPAVRWGSTTHHMYHQGFKPTAADVGAYTQAEVDSRTNRSVQNAQPLSTQDLNNVKLAGVYAQSAPANATTVLNYPVALAGSLVVWQGAGVIQEYRVFDRAETYTRAQYSGNAWTPWERTYNTSFKPTANDVGAYTKAETDGLVTGAEPPFPDVWIPFNDSLMMLAGTGNDIKVGNFVLGHAVSFSRDSSATYINKAGELVPAQPDEPRFCREGLLIEGAAINLARQSEDFTGDGWELFKTLSPKKYDLPASVGSSYRSFTGNSTAGNLAFRCRWAHTCDRVTIQLWVKLDKGAIFTLGVNDLGASIKEVVATGDWQHIVYTTTCKGNNAANYFDVQINNADGTPSNGAWVHLSRIQIEPWDTATSYIVTGAGYGTRAPDVVSIQVHGNFDPTLMTVALQYTDETVMVESGSTIPYYEIAGCDGIKYSMMRKTKYRLDAHVSHGSLSVMLPNKPVVSELIAHSYDLSTKVQRLRLGTKSVAMSCSPDTPYRQNVGVFRFGYGEHFCVKRMFIRDFRMWNRPISDTQFMSLK